jgi:hypothetical protein
LVLMDVVKIGRGCYIGCNYFRGLLQAFVQNVSSFQTYVAHVWIWMFTYVSQICCNNMFQIFHLFLKYIASDLSGCCICLQWLCCKYMFQMFHLFQTYVAIVLSEYCKSRSQCRVVERGRES